VLMRDVGIQSTDLGVLKFDRGVHALEDISARSKNSAPLACGTAPPQTWPHSTLGLSYPEISKYAGPLGSTNTDRSFPHTESATSVTSPWFVALLLRCSDGEVGNDRVLASL